MTIRIVLLFAVMVGVAMAADRFPLSEYQNRFTNWMTSNRRSYTSAEFLDRFNKFKINLDFIEEFNARNASYKLGLNDFADMLSDEFARIYLTLKKEPRSLEGAPEFTGEGVKVARANLDWRTSGAVGPVKNQGQCGSCWTFSTVGALESATKIASGTLPVLSEQQLVDCVFGPNAATGRNYSSQGCNGGSFNEAFSYVASKGSMSSSSYPYTGQQATCKYNAASVVTTITGYTRVTANDEGALLAAVTKQPVSVAIQSKLQSFQLYKSGVYSDDTCGKTQADLDHAVIAIGYGNDATTGLDYWLVRNSWGANWGNQGYIQMKRGVNQCGIAVQPSFPTGAASKSTSGSSTSGTTSTSTTAKATTGAATTGSVTTGTATTTGGARSGWVYQDAPAAGWNAAYSGSTTKLNLTADGVTGKAYSGLCPANSGLAFSSNPAFSTSGFTSVSLSAKASGATTLLLSTGSGPYQTKPITTAWTTISVLLSALGSPASVSTLFFINAGTTQQTIFVDNVKFA